MNRVGSEMGPLQAEGPAESPVPVRAGGTRLTALRLVELSMLWEVRRCGEVGHGDNQPARYWRFWLLMPLEVSGAGSRKVPRLGLPAEQTLLRGSPLPPLLRADHGAQRLRG